MSDSVQALIIDLDGTLLGPSGQVDPQDRDAVHRARDAGLEVVIATGRSLHESRQALAAINHDRFVVTAGGAMLSSCDTGETIDRDVMEPEVVEHVVHALVECGHKALLLKDAHATGYDYTAVGPHPYDPASTWWFGELSVEVREVAHLHEDAHLGHTVRAAAIAHSDDLAPLAEDLRQHLEDRAFLQHWAAVTESNVAGQTTHLLEVFHPQANKWTMIERLCARLHLDPSRTAAIGDGLNDVQLVRSAGLGIAMANADRLVLDVADHVTASNEQGGVARAINGILEGKWTVRGKREAS